MNWKERVDGIKFSIETGDGKTYFPLQKGGVKEKEFNTSSFEFINVYGTLVDRKKPQGGKFDLVFYFQGANNIDEADEFEVSADDPRPWVVNHPFYGIIKGQPISIKRDDSSLNITEITVPFWESIDADYPFFNFSVKDNTRDKNNKVYLASRLSAITNTKFAPADIAKMKNSILSIASKIKSIQNNFTYPDLLNKLNAGLKAIDKLLEDPLSAIRSVQNLLDLPSNYLQAVNGRIASYENVFNGLKSSVKTLADKKYFESIAASTISSMALTMVTPLPGDYVLVSDVDNMSERLNKIYKEYKDLLDDSQVSVYDVKNTYSPDATVQLELSSLINYTQANLYKISFTAKRERIVFTDKKTNIILLVHRYLGMDADDENISIFKKTNNIQLKELFAIPKGREIRYAK